MIAATIGQQFLDAYNKAHASNHSPRSFFEKIYCEQFYNHPKYMMTAGNAPLENPKISWDKMRKGLIAYETPEKRQERIQKTIQKIENEPPDASIAIGFPSLDTLATTSGQLTNLVFPFGSVDAYLSWIGAGLGVGIQGGYSLFFMNQQILLDVFEGWHVYRQYLNDNQAMRGNQITSWNGQWISHRYDVQKYDAADPTVQLEAVVAAKDGGMEVQMQSWAWLMFRLARQFPSSTETVYVYNLGQTNTTLGFVLLDLPAVRSLNLLYEKYFGTESREAALHLFGTAMGFGRACRMGAIGLQAMEPKGFRDCVTKGDIPSYREKKEEQILSFNTYKIWLLAMLKDESLWDKAERMAQLLYDYSANVKKAKADKSRKVDEVLKSTNKKQFLESLAQIVSDFDDRTELYEAGKRVDQLPADNVPYYLTLIRFNYTVINK